jgi:hypothetical protein
VRKHILTLAALAALAAGPAFAATIVQTQSIAAGSDATTPVTFQQFDTALGTLNSVTLWFDAAMSNISGTVYDPSTNGRTYHLTEGALAGFAGNGFNLSTTLSGGAASLNVAGKTTVNIGPFTDSESGTSTLNSGLAPYIGLGSVGFSFTRLSEFAVDNNGQIDITPLIGGDAKLTYNYTPSAPAAVPEPGTWAMLIVGFASIGAALRGRRRQATTTVVA